MAMQVMTPGQTGCASVAPHLDLGMRMCDGASETCIKNRHLLTTLVHCAGIP